MRYELTGQLIPGSAAVLAKHLSGLKKAGNDRDFDAGSATIAARVAAVMALAREHNRGRSEPLDLSGPTTPEDFD